MPHSLCVGAALDARAHDEGRGARITARTIVRTTSVLPFGAVAVMVTVWIWTVHALFAGHAPYTAATEKPEGGVY